MYRFKFYYKDGTKEVDKTIAKNPIELYNDFDGKISCDELQTLDEKKPSVHEVIEIAMKAYKKFKKDYYRIDIINDETDEVIDYIDESEAIVDGKKGHVTYDAYTGESIGAYADPDEEELSKRVYTFKFYYEDGTTEISSIRVKNPVELYNDFDGLIDWDEYDNLSAEKLTVHEVLEISMRAYKGFLHDFYRIEIVNVKTGEIVDYIEKD